MFVFFSIDPQILHWIKTALLIARYYGKLSHNLQITLLAL